MRDLIKLIGHLYWAMDIMDRYEERLIQFGDPREKVHSEVQLRRKQQARALLNRVWAELHEGMPCPYCALGHLPLANMHGTVPCPLYAGRPLTNPSV